MTIKLPSLPTPPPNLDPALRSYLLTVKSILDNYAVGPAAVVTAQNLDSYSTAITESVLGSSSTPPKLSGLFAIPGFSFVILAWDKISYGNAAYTTVYRSVTDNPDTAVAIGTSRTLVYADYVPNSGTFYYWIRSTSKAGVEGPFNQVAGVPGAAGTDETYLLEVLDGKIGPQQASSIFTAQAIGADVIGVNQLAAISADMGVVTAGLIQSPDQTFNIDLSNKEIVITGPNGQASDDYTVMRNGVLEAWKWTGEGHIQYKALTLLENGVANNNDMITLSGYYDSMPGIVVSPANIGAYRAEFSTQNQYLVCEAAEVTEFSPGRWKFRAKASLSLEAGAFASNISYNSGTSSNSSFASGVYTTPANCNNARFNGQVVSFRTNGTAYLYRRMYLTMYYRPAGTSAWIFATAQNFYPGATTGAVDFVFEYPFSSAGTYDFYFTADYYDAGGDWGSVGYWSYDQTVVNGTSASGAVGNNGGPAVNATQTLTAALGGYTPPSGWDIYQVIYSASVSGSLVAYGAGSCTSSASSLVSLGGRTISGGGTSYEPTNSSFNKTWSSTSDTSTFNPNYISSSISVSVGGSSCSDYARWAYASGTISSPQATIKIRKYVTGSTTPTNALSLGTVGYNLSSGLVLAEGTMNWFAIGR